VFLGVSGSTPESLEVSKSTAPDIFKLEPVFAINWVTRQYKN
jgi:hypothetical protein